MASEGIPTLLIVTVLVDELHGGLAMVQRNTLGPTPKAVTVEFGELGEVMVPLPLTSVQVPDPAVGVLAARVAPGPQTVCAEPALEVVVASFTVILTESVELPLAQVASDAFK